MRNNIEKIIYDHWEFELPISRNRLIDARENEQLITDIVGPRRAGKTYLMFSLIQNLPDKATIYINFENRKLLPLHPDYFNDIIEFIHSEKLLEEHKKIFLFLDEVQRLVGWEQYVRSIYDEFKGKIKIFASGSSSNLISENYAKLLTGRHLTTVVLPLSFKEFLQFKGIEVKDGIMSEKAEALIKKYLKEYLKYGGFPEIVEGKQKNDMLSQLFTDIVTRDLLSRTDIRNEDVMDELANYFAANVSNLFSFGKMTRYFNSRGLKISTPTLIQYFRRMKNAFLFFDSKIFSYKIRDQMQYPRKIYCIDNGIANIGGCEGLGNLFENALAIELLRRQYKIHYWRSSSGDEVDFIIKEHSKVRAIQACYDVDNIETREREVKSLIKCMKEVKLKTAEIITFDHSGREVIESKTINYVPIWRFLLDI
jgi:predicted AAA+ superfamily ATPase